MKPRRARSRLWALLCAGALSVAGPAPSAWADEPPPLAESLTGESRTAYDAAKVLYRDGDFAGGLLKFQQAFTLSHDPRLLWNMAACAKNLRRYTKVLELVDRYLAEGGKLLTDRDRKEANDFRAAILPFVSSVEISTDPGGAKVFVDEEPAGTTPLAGPLRVDLGSRKIRITKSGFKDYVLTQEVAGGSYLTLAIKLERAVQEGRLSVTAGPKDTIAFDGDTVGVGRWSATVGAGPHELKVTAPGMKPYLSHIDIRDGETRVVHAALDPEARSGVPTWVWIAGGVALAGGAAVGGYFLFKPADKPAPPATDGTLGKYQLPNAWVWR